MSIDHEAFQPGDLVELFSSVTGAVLNRGIVIRVITEGKLHPSGKNCQFLDIEFEDIMFGTLWRTDIVVSTHCRKMHQGQSL